MQYLKSEDVVGRLRRAVEAARSQQQFAKNNGISAPYLSDVLKGRRDPGPAVLRVLGLRALTVYVEDRVAAKEARP